MVRQVTSRAKVRDVSTYSAAPLEMVATEANFFLQYKIGTVHGNGLMRVTRVVEIYTY